MNYLIPIMCSICKFTKNCTYDTFIVNGYHTHYYVDYISYNPYNSIHYHAH